MQQEPKYVIIVAGGSGSRMQSTVPKQFLLLNGKPMLMHTLQQFYNADAFAQIIVALPETQINYWLQLCEEYNFRIPYSIVTGGETRFHSVQNALNTIESDEGIVAVHDGARPLVSEKLINACFDAAIKHQAVVPVIIPSESLRIWEQGNSKAVDRAHYRIVQTPQCFSVALLKKAYQQPFTSAFTDDATVVEALGQPITLIEGETSNIKITTPEDLRIAGILIK